ncbi:DUF6924 domain-containing protein [Streptomyces sp. DW26H14]|uniref:DUF6924 domain-containing protein n=1 Tax=Streptomyces sp. DW26H14 TaxID=3435395 RepID=UPI00403DACC6
MAAAQLPETEFSPLLRTDFTDEAAWRALLDEIGDDWLTVLADPAHEGLSVDGLLALVPAGSRFPVLVVADEVTFSGNPSGGRTLLLIDAQEEPGRTFRAEVPGAFTSALGNLAISNLGFGEYLDSLDGSGVYRLSPGYLRAMAELEAAGRQAGPGDSRAAGTAPGAVRGRIAGPGSGRGAAPRAGGAAPGILGVPPRP